MHRERGFEGGERMRQPAVAQADLTEARESAEMPRFSAVLTAVLTARNKGWQAVSLTFSATGQ